MSNMNETGMNKEKNLDCQFKYIGEVKRISRAK